MKYPKKFKDLIEGFESFPGIGPKTAERLAFYAISKQSKDTSLRFADSLKDAISSICECEVCGMIADESKCEIEIQVRPTRELDQQLFSFIPDVEVLYPEWYRQHILEKIEENLKKYLSEKNGCTDNAELCTR